MIQPAAVAAFRWKSGPASCDQAGVVTRRLVVGAGGQLAGVAPGRGLAAPLAAGGSAAAGSRRAAAASSAWAHVDSTVWRWKECQVRGLRPRELTGRW